MAFLRASWKRRPKREAQGVYIAFEDKDYREKDAIQWLDRNNNSQIHYDYHDARNEQSAWYRAPKQKRNGIRCLKTLLRQGGAPTSRW